MIHFSDSIHIPLDYFYPEFEHYSRYHMSVDLECWEELEDEDKSVSFMFFENHEITSHTDVKKFLLPFPDLRIYYNFLDRAIYTDPDEAYLIQLLCSPPCHGMAVDQLEFGF